ncbi:MAG TPA: DUF3800 domain-containing protein [Candidatus Baltobacteraceae bacterium]|nr:DUF3800 domain-containing protein [Candidatus Baltobacteraceae bacterium]
MENFQAEVNPSSAQDELVRLEASKQGSLARGLSLYVDEGGSSHPFNGSERKPYFIIGVLVTPEHEAFRSEIEAFCATQRYQGPYHWIEQSKSELGQQQTEAYRNLAEYIRAGTSSAWDFHARLFPAINVNEEDFGHSQHYAYKKLLQIGIDEALDATSFKVGKRLEIILSGKSRDSTKANGDSKLKDTKRYLEEHYSTQFPEAEIEVRWVPQETDRNLQICDMFTSTYHTYITPDHCKNTQKWDLAKVYSSLIKCDYQEYMDHTLHPQEVLSDAPPRNREDIIKAAIKKLHAKYGTLSEGVREEIASHAIDKKPKLAENGKLVAIETSENAFVVVNRWDYPRGTFLRELVSIDPQKARPHEHLQQIPSNRDIVVQDARAVLADRLGIPPEKIIEKARPPRGTLEGEVIALGEKHFAVVSSFENGRFTIVQSDVFSFEKPAVGDQIRIKFVGRSTEGTVVHRPGLRHESQDRKMQYIRDRDGQRAKSLAQRNQVKIKKGTISL